MGTTPNGSAPPMKSGLSATTQSSSGTFVLTDSMNTARAMHTSTLLATGQVLETGGVDSNGNALASAELFDPTVGKGKFRTTGSMSVGRVFHTATLLPNGKVLVAGGAPALNGNCVATAELFDPSTGQWSATGSMTQRRCSHSATLLANGKVLVAGGDVDTGSSLVSSEIFNPATGTWQATGNLNQPRANQLSALLQNGKVLVAAGRDFTGGGSFTDLASAELFDPSQGTWSLTGSLSRADGTPFGSPLANGDVLAARIAFFTPSSGTWTNTGATPTNLGLGTTATLLTTGKVLLTGFITFCRGCGFFT